MLKFNASIFLDFLDLALEFYKLLFKSKIHLEYVLIRVKIIQFQFKITSIYSNISRRVFDLANNLKFIHECDSNQKSKKKLISYLND